MQFQPNAASVRKLISRRIQITFIVGLLLGILIGWFFSGLVGAVMRFGFALVLLVPLVLAIMFWWKLRNAKPEGEAMVYTWNSSQLPSREDDVFQRTHPGQRDLNDVVIDPDDIRRERKP